MGYTGKLKTVRNEDLSDKDKLIAIMEFRDILGKVGVIPASPNHQEFHKKTEAEVAEVEYDGPLVLDYGIVQTILFENPDLALFSSLVKRIYEYREVKGTIRQIANAIEDILRDFPLGLLYYQSKYNSLAWVYFRKILMDEVI